MLFIPITANAIPELIDQGVPLSDIRSVLIRVASRFTPLVQKSAPVDTGALRRSLRVDLLDDDSGVAIVSTVFYAGFVEFGTRKMRPRMFAQSLVPDLIGYMNELLSDLGQFQISPIQKIGVGERSNLTSQTVSEGYLARVNGNRVATGYVKPLSVPTQGVQANSVASLSIEPSSIEPGT